MSAAVLIAQPAPPARAAEPPTPPAYAAGPADLEVSSEETRSILPRHYSWARIENVGGAPSDGIKVATRCGYLTEGGDVAALGQAGRDHAGARSPGSLTPDE